MRPNLSAQNFSAFLPSRPLKAPSPRNARTLRPTPYALCPSPSAI
jgi:hypothetical protein